VKLKLDEETDTLYLRLDESTTAGVAPGHSHVRRDQGAIVESEEVQPGVVLDFNSDNRVVGIEMLNISKRVEREKLLDFHFQSNLRRS
jgi:uncharacterized protein YuzE